MVDNARMERTPPASLSSGRRTERHGAVRELARRATRTVIEIGALLLHRLADALDALSGRDETRRLDALLSAERRVCLERLFGDGLDLDAIRVRRGGIRRLVGMAPHAIGNDLFLTDTAFDVDGGIVDLGLLCHELAHSWQFQNGGRGYLSAAIISYVVDGRERPYDWRAALAAGLPFDAMTPDQQAELARVIGLAIDAGPSADERLTRAGLGRIIGRLPSDEQFERFSDIHRRLLAGER